MVVIFGIAAFFMFNKYSTNKHLILGIEKNDQVLIKTELAKGADPNFRIEGGEPLIVYASNKGQADTVQLLLSFGADANATNANGWSAIQHAAAQGYLEIVKVLVGKGVSVDTHGQIATPLLLAAANGKLDVVEFLLASDANPKIADMGGATPLDAAVAGEYQAHQKNAAEDETKFRKIQEVLIQGKPLLK